MFRFRPGNFHRKRGSSTFVPTLPDQASHRSVQWTKRPGFQLRKSRPKSTVIEPYFTSIGTSTVAWVGELKDAAETDFTFVDPPPLAAATIDGVSYVIRRQSIDVHEVEGTTANTATFKVQGTEPQEEQTVVITLGGILFFAGTIQAVTQGFDEITNQLWWNVEAIDWSFTLNRRVPFGSFTDVSATAVVTAGLMPYAPGFSSSGVQAGLPPITIAFDGSQTWMECLEAVRNELGPARCKVDYSKVIHLYYAEAQDAPDQLNNTTNTTLVRDPELTSRRDVSQLRNRVFVKGAGTTVAQGIPTGSTRIPVKDIGVLPSSGQVITNGQVLSYGGNNIPRVKSRAVPPAPTLKECTTSNLFAYTAQNIQLRQQWIYADGHESSISPPSATTLFSGTKQICWGATQPPADVVTRRFWISSVPSPAQPTWTSADTAILQDVTGNAETGSTDYIGFTTQTGVFTIHHTTFYTTDGAWVATGGGGFHTPSPSVSGDYTVTSLAGDQLRLQPSVGGPSERSINSLPPGFIVTSAAWNFVAFDSSGTALGMCAADVSTGLGGSVHKNASGSLSDTYNAAYPTNPGIVSLISEELVAVFHISASKVISVFMEDSVSDSNFLITGGYSLVWTKSSLPTTQYRRGNTRLSVQLPPGTNDIKEIFCPTGGTALLDGQPIDYTAVDSSSSELTGIPEDGPGAIGCDHTDVNGDPVSDNCGITAVDDAPSSDPEAATPVQPGAGNGCENGTGTLLLSAPTSDFIPEGAPINLWIQRDDLESQAEFNVRERPVLDEPDADTMEELAAIGDADLDLFSQPIVTVNYSTRDRKTTVGKTIDINLTDPPLVGSYLIQDVSITQVDEADNLNPLYRVQASSVKFTFDDLLRLVRLR